MPQFRLPLSGNVTQSILPWTWVFNPTGNQIGLVNIELGQSSAPVVEEEVLSDVASYGKQLGRVEDALLAILDHLKSADLERNRAIVALREITNDIAKVKTRHGR